MRLHNLLSRVSIALVLVAFVVAPVEAGNVLPAKDIEWENLQPDVEPAAQDDASSEVPAGDQTEQWLSQQDPFQENIPNSEEEAIAEQSQFPQQESAPVVKKFDGKRVRLAGYMVPLDFESTKLKQFLLVPYVGACIHVPPPATNQVVFIESDKPIEFTGLYDPVYVTGTMSTTSSKTELAEAGYKISADGVAPYE